MVICNYSVSLCDCCSIVVSQFGINPFHCGCFQWCCTSSSVALPGPPLLVTITLELPRNPECSRLLSQYPLEAFGVKYCAGLLEFVHMEAASFERMLFTTTRGGRLSYLSVCVWKVLVLFLQGTTLFLKKYKKITYLTVVLVVCDAF